MRSYQMKKSILGMVIKRSPKSLKIYNMSVQSSSTNLITTWLRNERFSESCQHRPGKHDRAAQATAFFSEGFTMQIIDIDIISLEDTSISFRPLDLHIHFSQ